MASSNTQTKSSISGYQPICTTETDRELDSPISPYADDKESRRPRDGEEETNFIQECARDTSFSSIPRRWRLIALASFALNFIFIASISTYILLSRSPNMTTEPHRHEDGDGLQFITHAETDTNATEPPEDDPSKWLANTQSPSGQIHQKWSPAAPHLTYMSRHIFHENWTYTAPPNQTIEANWEDLLSGTLIRVSAAELAHTYESSIPLKDGGYAASLGVGHSLHCLRRIYMFLYYEHYYPEQKVGRAKLHEMRHHAAHCLDTIRQALTCYVDYSLLTLKWDGTKTGRPMLGGDPYRKCVNWEALHGWMLERTVEEGQMLDRDGGVYEEPEDDG